LFSVYLIRLQRASNRDSLSNSETGGRKRKHADSPDNDEEDPPVRMTGRNMKKSDFFKDPESVAVSRPRRVNKPSIEEAKEDEQIEDSEMQDDEQEDEENNQARKLVFEKKVQAEKKNQVDLSKKAEADLAKKTAADKAREDRRIAAAKKKQDEDKEEMKKGDETRKKM